MGFSKDFLWGAATASYQIEGAWNEDGKEMNIRDAFCHEGKHIKNGESADVSCDHYHLYKDDVKLMVEAGLKAYRFSISWSRILKSELGKDGRLTFVENPKGIAFYDSLINELLANKITPFITLYHWDLPQSVYEKGGWLNREISDWFEFYARTVVNHFGDRVKNFITFNEPSVFVGMGYKDGVHAPGYKLSSRDLVIIGHNVHLAHGKAVRLIHECVKDAKVGITLATMPVLPENKSEEAVKAAYEDYFACSREYVAWAESFWLDPIVKGAYPESLVAECEDLAYLFSKEDMDIISEKIDFVGLNIYQGRFAKADMRAAGAPHTDLNWNITPDALYWGTKFFYERYKLPIYITENGMACHDYVSLDGKVHDPNRIDYLNRYLLALKESVESGVDVRGYFQWSLIDNFEWAEGFNPRFGIIYCDYATKKRIFKDSAYWYKKVIESNGECL